MASASEICALLRAMVKMSEGVVATICAAVAAIFVFPLGLALYDALGRPILPFVAVLIALVTTTFASLLAGIPALRRPLIASIAAATASRPPAPRWRTRGTCRWRSVQEGDLTTTLRRTRF
jgi:p-aminobenzoyl-glutamate transporter AbgT